MREITFELCAESIDACVAARDGGAHRIELCSNLAEGGVTPSLDLIRTAVEISSLPLHVLIRARTGNFLYTGPEIKSMRDQIEHAKRLGASGVVLGILLEDNTVDIDRTRSLVQLARPMEVTFHRAFDQTPSLHQALDDVIATGADRILTSGGASDVFTGSSALAHLLRQARGRITIAVGGGLRMHNAVAVALVTGAIHFHGSLRDDKKPNGTSAVHANTVSRMIQLLQSA